MDSIYYDMMFKRKSFHTFPGREYISEDELQQIKDQLTYLKPLASNIRTAFRMPDIWANSLIYGWPPAI